MALPAGRPGGLRFYLEQQYSFHAIIENA